ncbi:flippase [Vibrio metschnikovii]|uniref:flippase n=1 Tax=Vibrio metschnikovii TaxID=28172 RepID=UPI002FC74000
MVKKLTPHSLLNKAKPSRNIIENILWLFLDKFLRMGLGVFVVIWMARYFGPEKFGLFNYTTALIALFGAFSGLGLNAIMTRDLVVKAERGEILGTALVIRLLSSLIAYVGLIISIFLLRKGEDITQYLIFIMGITLLFNSSDIIKFWFESQILSKYTVFVENCVFFVSASVKLLLIYFEAPLIAFAYAVLAEAVFVFFGLFWIYSKRGSKERLSFSLKQAKYLFSQSWPLIISSAAWIIYTKIDQIMIGQMLDDNKVGLYSAASKLSEIANFFPAVIAFSFIPMILKLKEKDREKYERYFQNLYYLVITLTIIVAIFVTSISGGVISLLYGESFSGSEKVLSIHFWIVVLVALATISGRYLVNDNLQKLTMKRHLLGVCLNIPFNYIAIQKYGINGAAYASLLSLFIANYVFDALDRQTRTVFMHKTKALSFFWIYELFISKNSRK